MADSSVRPARLTDVDALADVQLAGWAATPGLPSPVQLPTRDDVIRAWERAVVAPPSARHAVWSALADDHVVGLAAVAPATDPDLDGRTTSELLTLVIDPHQRGHGHGSRLLAAAMQGLREAGVQVAVCWLPTQDDRTRAFLSSAGWAADGAFRTLAEPEATPDAEHLRQLRLGTDLTAEPPGAP